MSEKPSPPAGLSESGSVMWSEIVGKYDLRSDELRVLKDACFEADLIDDLGLTSLDMLRQIFTTFRPGLFPQLIVGYWEVFALMALGFFLHFVPDSWEHACSKAVVRLPLIGKALLLVAIVYLVIQMKSSEIQPFIYFQF